ncbi:OmpA family protein [Qipengyuania sp. MTN3-11]|uniref:OmpA family protein n=1 Tax=Qipengyuania sp. MTN3-11 TaxID=3056557 RepID=UPI0036F27545
MRANSRNRAVLTALAATTLTIGLAACDRGEQPPEPKVEPDEPPTSIIREGFEEPVNEVIPLSPLDMRIPFADGESELSETAVADLETLLKSPQMAAGGPVILRAHSDSGGSDEVNMRVSRERGELVRDWLLGNGVAEERIQLIVFGEQNPIEPNAMPDGTPNEAGRALNRRVDIHVGVEEPREPSMAEEFDESAGEEDEAEAATQQNGTTRQDS